jgi:RNA polymerase sigma-70 factor (ECF subfamily)
MAARGATVEALESLYRADLPRFVRAATAIVGDEGAGRDAVQDAFVQAVRKRTGYKGEASLETWVWRIVVNEALAVRRSRASDFESASESATTPSTNHVPEEDAAVRAWVAALPERQRLAVFLF